jgi:hypothetical protein
MGAKILKNFGWCRIFSIGDRYFMTFDEGGVVVEMNSYEITKEEAFAAIENEIEAEKIARAIQKRKK